MQTRHLAAGDRRKVGHLLMTFLSGAAECVQLIVSDRLEAMLSHQPKAFQLRSNYPSSLGLVVQLERFYSLGIQRVVGHEHLAQISFHYLFLSPERSRHDAMPPRRVFSLPLLISLDGVGVHQCFVREFQHIGQGSCVYGVRIT